MLHKDYPHLLERLSSSVEVDSLSTSCRVTILVLFDFSKAFDTVSHSKLLIKLRGLGFFDIVLTWVHSYLTGRTQVDKGSECSTWLATSSGVP